MRFRSGEPSWRPAPLPVWALVLAAGVLGFTLGFAVAFWLARGA